MSDEELLNLAAKAIGHSAKYNLAGACQLFKNDEYVCFWDPLKYDGDASRLAVELNLAIKPLPMRGPPAIECWQNKDLMQTWTQSGYVLEEYESCPHAATRRAIVLAAAAIGKAMP